MRQAASLRTDHGKVVVFINVSEIVEIRFVLELLHQSMILEWGISWHLREEFGVNIRNVISV